MSFLASLSCASLVNLHVCPSLLLYLSLDNKVNKPIPSSRVSAIYGLYGPTGRAYGPYGPTGRTGPRAAATGLRARALRLTGPPTGLRAGALKLTGLYGPTGPRAIRAGPTGLRARALGPPGVNGQFSTSVETFSVIIGPGICNRPVKPQSILHRCQVIIARGHTKLTKIKKITCC